MARLSELVENRKAKLIERLIAQNVYKTSDHRHLYDVPLDRLESEYRLLKENGKKV
ncbi:Fur-regulated basic protein FbpA [Neobacillus sp. PS3-34]|uniref:Fur-regulated basic protein FbpA n=1 Tax=Neobacillus sp. PS3-34 TaxID=3070678 RepID=UPI0027E11B50|nr:Fur-regulated basic protein FbpA [Neobacillus sp. PS3-34]WML49784.1 Fur-regulated basic protein FbpA [Neobacillus sp. PS3-34]